MGFLDGLFGNTPKQPTEVKVAPTPAYNMVAGLLGKHDVTRRAPAAQARAAVVRSEMSKKEVRDVAQLAANQGAPSVVDTLMEKHKGVVNPAELVSSAQRPERFTYELVEQSGQGRLKSQELQHLVDRNPTTGGNNNIVDRAHVKEFALDAKKAGLTTAEVVVHSGDRFGGTADRRTLDLNSLGVNQHQPVAPASTGLFARFFGGQPVMCHNGAGNGLATVVEPQHETAADMFKLS